MGKPFIGWTASPSQHGLNTRLRHNTTQHNKYNKAFLKGAYLRLNISKNLVH